MSFAQIRRDVVLYGLAARGQAASAQTGTIAAGLTAGSAVWTFRYPEAAGGQLLVQRLAISTVNIVGFTSVITAGRALDLVRLVNDAPATADPSGGAAFTPVRKATTATIETLGVGRVATTGALTITGFTASAPIKSHVLTSLGAAGNIGFSDFILDPFADPVVLAPGHALAVVAKQTFDIVGTFQVTVMVDAVELTP